MSQHGPILLIDDDADECELVAIALERENIRNKLKCFSDGDEALQYLKTTSASPFIILTDINMPKMGGLELRAAIEANRFLKEKSIPFVFLTTSASPPAIKRAYELSVQGFFEKGSEMRGIQRVLRLIFDYWSLCKHPNQ